MSNFRFFDIDSLDKFRALLKDPPEWYKRKQECLQMHQKELLDFLGIEDIKIKTHHHKIIDSLCEDLGFKLDRNIMWEVNKGGFVWFTLFGKFRGYQEDRDAELKHKLEVAKEESKTAMENGTYWLNNSSCKGGVYLVESGGFYKIGKSKNIKSRLSSLKTGSPNGVELLSTYEPYAMTRDRLEKLLHERYADSRTTGEWFTKDFTVEDFEKACVEISNRKAR